MYASIALGLLTALGASSQVAAQTTGAAPAAQSPGPSVSAPTPGPSSFVAHTDSVCGTPMAAGGNAVFDNIKQHPEFSTFANPNFPGAVNADGGYLVYFAMDDAPSTCRNMVMVPYTQSTGAQDSTHGKQIINVSKKGCYGARIPGNTTLFMSQCCGDACQDANMNNTMFNAPAQHARRGLSRAKPPAKVQRSSIKEVVDSEASSGSPAARAKSLVSRFLFAGPAPPRKCTFHPQGAMYAQAGNPITVSSAEICPQAPCQIQVATQRSFSYTATTEHTNTIQSSFGTSVTVSGGIEFPVKADVSAEVNAEFTASLADATGNQVMNGNTTTLTYAVGIEPSQNTLATFTPNMKCYTGPYDCATDKTSDWVACIPEVDDKGMLVGEYGYVVTDN